MLNGACYVMNKNLDDIKVLRPLIRKAFQVIEPETYLHALAEAGFSAQISQDNELILGTPGSMDWTGDLVTYGIPSDPEGELKLKVIGRLSTLKVPQIQQYIGYSVASGNFFESMGRSFVAGAPRDTADYRGAVYFFKPETPDSSNLNVQLKKEGEQASPSHCNPFTYQHLSQLATCARPITRCNVFRWRVYHAQIS
ncbi:unnamed protein product [Ixodes pacificus]